MTILNYQPPQAKRRFPWLLPISLWAGGFFLSVFVFGATGEIQGIFFVAVANASPAAFFLLATWLIYFRTRRIWMHYANIAAFIIGVLNPVAAVAASIVSGFYAAVATYLFFPACLAYSLTFPEPPCTCPACGGGCEPQETRCPHCKRDLTPPETAIQTDQPPV
ncbi:MAG TPA: hypothetical protein VHM90_16475 [Phycisphaerae bacterium]|nr:hypothetical protein [Phycisphaerae bacterium]